FDLDAVKNDPELRTKISNFVSLLSTGDKAALAYTQNIFDRKPPLSTEKIKDVFDKLTSMMNTSYDPKVGNTKELVISALHDVSMPSDISQEGIGTCVGTSIQIQLAIRNPSEYLNMLDTLAQNKIYTSITGANIPPNFTFTDEGIEKNLDTGRTISAKIMQNAIMDFSDMNTRDFNSAKGDGGLNYIQTVKGLKEIVNTNVETSYVWDYTPEQLINTLKNSKPDRSNPIEISMSYEPNGRDSIHSVNVINISDNQVTIVNPWGREETFPNDELNKRILSVSAPVNTDRGVIKVNVTDQVLKNKIADNNTKLDALKNISVEQKIEIVRNITSGWDGNKFSIKSDIPQSDRIVVINILDDLLKQGTAQNNVWLPRLKFFAPDMADFLNKVQVNNETFTKLSTKLLSNQT
ncbi:MAG: hypothetical protein H7263_10345, partial [Candidatus Sericytochromatia bacterium]|nr:hypothetical protein [Candidatus Sericytochromatia bacterium]